MIVSFGDQATEDLFHGRKTKASRKLPSEIVGAAVRKLDMLNAAREVNDLRSPPGNRLERLTGDRAGLHSIRINRQWRIVFRWVAAEAHDVQIVDYH